MRLENLPQTPDERLRQTEANLRRWKYPRLGWPLPDRAGTVAIVGFGTTLAKTWESVKDCDAICTTSGAHDFLIERGVVPNYHVEIDPREHKAFFLRHSHPQVHYLIADTCHLKLWAQLYAKKRRVTMWHGWSDEDKDRQIALVKRYEPNAALLSGGTNAGLRAAIVMRHIGFRKFMLFGIDCCYEGDQEWAGPHSGKKHSKVKVRVAGRVFSTSDVMMQATDDFFNQMFSTPGCAFGITGDGLLATRFEIYKRDRTLACSSRWWEPVDFTLREPA